MPAVFFLRKMFKKTRRFAAKNVKNNSQKRLKNLAASRQKTLKKTLKKNLGKFSMKTYQDHRKSLVLVVFCLLAPRSGENFHS